MKMLRSHTLRTAVALMMIVSMTIAPTQVNASIEGARLRALQLFATLQQRFDLNVREDYWRGFLHRGEVSNPIRTTLYAGNNYKIVASGCEDAYDVDVIVFDENGNEVARDADSSFLAVANVTPAWSGTFYVKVRMYNSTLDGAHFVLMYAFE